MKLDMPPEDGSRSWSGMARGRPRSHGARPLARDRPQAPHAAGKALVPRLFDLTAQAFQQMMTPFGKIDDARTQALRMQAHPQGVERGRSSSSETPSRSDVIAPLARTTFQCDQRQGRGRAYARAPRFRPPAGRRHIGRVHRPFGMNRRITRRQHQPVGGAGGHGKRSASFSSISRLGEERPLSTKLR